MIIVTVKLKRKTTTVEEKLVCKFNTLKEVKTFVNKTSNRLGKPEKIGYIKFNLQEGSLMLLPISEVSTIKIEADEKNGVNFSSIAAAE